MERLLNDELVNQIQDMLNVMKEEIEITFFHKEGNESSDLTKKLLNEIAVLNDKITFNEYNFDNKEMVEKYNVKTAPAFLINTKGSDARGAFYGVPAGHEINTLLATIIDASEANPLYDEEILNKIANIDKPMNVKVFVTTACPHCPGAAINGLRLAQLNKNITAEVYEVHSNMDLAQQYKVAGVPRIVIDETKVLEGNHPISSFLE